MGVSPESLAKSRQTISAYEDYAERYDAIVRHVPNPREQASLKRLVAIAGTDGQILEVGSGPGYDADFLESLGVKVRRTDATKRFLELQAARGKHGELLDLITDDLGGPYDAVLALCVLIHVPRDQTDQLTPSQDSRVAAARRRLSRIDAQWRRRDIRRISYGLLAQGRLRGPSRKRRAGPDQGRFQRRPPPRRMEHVPGCEAVMTLAVVATSSAAACCGPIASTMAEDDLVARGCHRALGSSLGAKCRASALAGGCG
jgi:SAM-dependent methyltransferase